MGTYKRTWTVYADLWAYDFALNRFDLVNVRGEALGKRSCFAAGYIERTETCVIFGGDGTSPEFGRARCLDMNSLQTSVPKMSGEGPASQARYGSCVVGTTLYLRPGSRASHSPSSLLLLHCEKRDQLRWSRPKETGLITPYRFNCTLVACGSRLFFLGGTPMNDSKACFFYSTRDEQWHKVRPAGKAPSSHSHISVYVNGTIYCYGGFMTGPNQVFTAAYKE